MLRKILALALLVVLGAPGSAALAHDTLVDISPKAGEVIESSKFQVLLTFNNPPLLISGESNALVATRLAGTNQWLEHPVSLSENVLTADVELLVSGEYELSWQVISSDGHPISGESNFVLNIANSTEEEPVIISPNPSGESEIAASPLSGFYIGLAMVVLGAVFAPIGLLMRRKAKRSAV